MIDNRHFIDTNVLLYAHDTSAGARRDTARGLLGRLWESREGCLSVQVLQEFYVNVTKKIPKPLDVTEAKAILEDLSRWYIHVPAADDVLAAASIQQACRISFWDAMVVRSAAELGCGTLYSEDLSHGQRYCGVLVQNPFRPGDLGLVEVLGLVAEEVLDGGLDRAVLVQVRVRLHDPGCLVPG